VDHPASAIHQRGSTLGFGFGIFLARPGRSPIRISYNEEDENDDGEVSAGLLHLASSAATQRGVSESVGREVTRKPKP